MNFQYNKYINLICTNTNLFYRKDIITMRRCPNCDSLLPDQSIFCGNCGLKQENTNEKKCNKCGNSIPLDSNFCPHCGISTTRNSEVVNDTSTKNPLTTESSSSPQINLETTNSINAIPLCTYDLDPYILSEIDNFKFSFTQKYAEFNGRASRGEYCRYVLIQTLLLLLVMVISIFITYISKKSEYILWAVFLFDVIFFLPSLSIATRRAHDLDNPGWTSVLLFIPIINTVYTLYLLLKKGNPAPNKYGYPTSFEHVTPKISAEKNIQFSPAPGSASKFILTIVVLIGIIAVAFVSMDSNKLPSNTTKSKPSNSATTANTSKTVSPSESNPQSTSTPQPVVQPENNYIEQSTNALRSYYDKLNQKNFNGAYALLSEQQQASVGYYNTWRNGYNTTLNVTLTSTRVLSANPNQVIYEYQLHAKDSINGRVKHQFFTGNVTMERVNSTWYIKDQDGRLVSSYFE